MQKGTSLLENNSFLQVLQGISANNNINNSKDIFYLLYVLQTVFILYLHSNTAVSISMSLSQMNKQNLRVQVTWPRPHGLQVVDLRQVYPVSWFFRPSHTVGLTKVALSYNLGPLGDECQPQAPNTSGAVSNAFLSQNYKILRNEYCNQPFSYFLNTCKSSATFQYIFYTIGSNNLSSWHPSM